MKTYAHINAAGEVVGIGMVCYESGELLSAVQDAVSAAGSLDAGLLNIGDQVKQDASLTTIVIDTADMPGGSGMGYDKTFRAAFKHAAGKIDVDMPRARNILRDMMRNARGPLLEKLDAEYMRADETGDHVQKKAIAKQKQDLRDVTAAPEIEAAATPDALKAVWPAILL